MIHRTFTGDYIDLSQVAAISKIYLDLTENNTGTIVSFNVLFKNTISELTCKKVYKTPEKLNNFEGINEFTQEMTEKLQPTIDAWKKHKQEHEQQI